MDEQRARRLNALFEEAVQLGESARAAWLAGREPRERADLEALLRAYDHPGKVLARPALDHLAPRGLEPGARVGAYRVVRRIGEGGGGTVYEAEQRSPRRRVALKVRPTALASEASLRRFREEAQTLARLQHPDIAHVYEAGVHGDLAWFAMELVVDARTLTEHARGLDRRTILELFARVCDAVAHGHARGVVHRDLKPPNLLVLPGGFPKVIDFGIAWTEGKGPGEGEGEIAGTPPYMSPEQCVPGPVDERSDVYSLGAVLYELLTGRLPQEVGDATLAEATRRVREDPPAPAGLPSDLEAILAKAMAKDPAARYASAGALAADVRRRLAGRPVAAAGGGAAYRAWTFVRRNRVACALLLLGLAPAAWFALRGPRTPPPRVDAARAAAVRAYATRIALAREELDADPARARAVLAGTDPALRGWEWRWLQGALDASTRTIAWPGARLGTGTVSGDGRRAAALGAEGGRWHVRVWELDRGRVAWTAGVGDGHAYSLAFAPDGATLAVGFMSGELELRSAADGSVVRRIDAHGGNVTAILFHPRGDWLATASQDRTVKLWSPVGEPLRTLRGHEDRAICLSLHGTRLASGGRDGRVCIWDLAGDGPPDVVNFFSGISVEGVAWRPDGRAIAAAARDGRSGLWEVGGPVTTIRHHRDVARAVAFAPSGARYATASWDGTVVVCDGKDRRVTARLRGHTGKVMAVTFRGDDELITFATDGTIRFWDPDPRDRIAGSDDVVALAFSPDGATLASATRGGGVEVRDGRTLHVRERWEAPFLPRHLAYAGRRLLCAGDDGLLAWGGGAAARHPAGAPFDVADGIVVAARGGALEVLTPGLDPVRSEDKGAAATALAARGDTVAVGGAGGGIRLRRLPGLEVLRARAGHGVPVRALRWSPDGACLAAAWEDGAVRILDAATLATRVAVPARARMIAFAPDGGRLATAGDEGEVRLWDVETGEPVLTLQVRAAVTALAFCGDGTTLAAGCAAPAPIRLWRAR